tara:strand:+ start:3850 stop:4503 length:654 start_codon:yes stop_codon:yes gene_type:complete
MDLTLYHFPAACSRVTMHALTTLGLPFADEMVNLRNLEQSDPQYLALNPKGKVPTLVMDGTVLTENAAILWTLHQLHSDGGLLPRTSDPVAAHQLLADLAWCSGTLHPMVRQVRMPMKWTTGESEGVREHGIAALEKECVRRSAQIGDGWWYGDEWSIIDTYFYWGYSTAAKGGFPLDRFPGLEHHASRVRSLDSFGEVLAREQAALESAGIDDIPL